MPSVLIDGFNLGLEKGTGVATYARNLSYELKELGFEVNVLYGNRGGTSPDSLLREIEFFDTQFGSGGSGIQQALRGGNILRIPFGLKGAEVPITGKVVAQAFDERLPRFDRIYNCPDGFYRGHLNFSLRKKFSTVRLPRQPDIAHWTYPLPVRVKNIPNIYTLHDIVPLRLPYTTLDNKKNYHALIRTIGRQADHVVTVSECSKRDLVEIAGISPDRITNTYQSVSIPAKYRDKPEDQVAREVEGAAGVGYKEYYLFWGAIEPKKNVGRMIEAYLASKVDVPLVIVGAKAWKSEGELNLLDSNANFARAADNDGLSTRKVILLNYLPFSLLVSMIRGARAALFPSLYEGFGLPALEAMALGTPVICSNTSSLPEIVRDAAVLIDPYDPGAISAAIRHVDADEDLRADLRQRGLAQAEEFAPCKYRERLRELYDRLI